MQNKIPNPKLLLVAAFLLTIQLPLMAQMKISKLFNDGMVLQRNQEISVWGWAGKGDKITISFNGNTYNAKTNRSGKWLAKLPAMSAGGPYEMTISGEEESRVIRDILVGDVWICSGQSNMEWPVSASNNAEKEIASAHDNMIRHFKVPKSSATTPEDQLAGGDWKIANPENVGHFTAVGYFFARELRKHHPNIPIGLINTSWGGSRLEPWMSAESLGMEDPEKYLEEVTQKNIDAAAQKKKNLIEKLGEIPKEDPGLVNGKAVWATPGLDDSGWLKMKLPNLWEAAGYDGLDGIVWFRTTINLTEEEAANGIELGLASIDDSDITWINGHKIGSTNGYNVARVYKASPAQLKAGENVIAIRVEDTGGGGGIYGNEESLYVKTSSGIKTLAGNWKFKVGKFEMTVNTNDNQVPTLLYNKMIYPLLNFPVKGAIWYQGESNADQASAYKYRELFATMIKDWREKWNVGDFPFLFVQLANFMAADKQPSDSYWAVLRESQSATLAVPNTAQAVIIDIGEADDIHPRNKQDVGLRLSLAARKLAFGEDVVYSGPVYKNHRVSGGKVIVEFDHTGSGLWVKDKYGYVNGFAIAGADKKFVWAKARQEGDKIIVWSEEVKAPAAIRYGWGNNPDDLNLYNKEGLPASPFRTDNW